MTVALVENGCRYCGTEIRPDRTYCSGGCSFRDKAGQPRGPRGMESLIPPDLDTRWKEQALCRGLDGINGPDFFGFKPAAQLRFCANCPVAADCLAYAEACEAGFEGRAEQGVIYGGTCGKERAQTLRRRAS